jgi:hypothetical protein
VTAEAYLTPEGEEAWLRLKQHLEWCDAFALAFIFTNHARVVRVFRERLADIYRARVTRLIIPEPERPADLLDRMLPDLLRPPPRPLTQRRFRSPNMRLPKFGNGSA